MSKQEKAVTTEPEVSVESGVVKKTFKKIKSVTRTVVKLEIDKAKYLRLDSAIVVGKAMKAREGQETMPPAMTCDVTDMETGELHILLCNSVLHSELKQAYPDDSYVGKTFEIINTGKLPGRRYFTFSIAEVEV